MIKIYIAFFFSLIIIICSCSGTDCDQLPKSYSSYNDAEKIIKKADFKIEEKVNTSKSSWVRGAQYYSCDGITGFFILKTNNENYLHSGLPVKIWEGFKNSKSFGRYYNEKIKNRYFFNLNK